ncbi:flagellar basal body-associated FliL family protein [Candidatus Sumerlaeota bacterium]|nr:flagellar basal body-associated FliL family protein [Candidatus Sumerlaeota bacterium]
MYNHTGGNGWKWHCGAAALIIGALAMLAPRWNLAADETPAQTKIDPFGILATKPLRPSQLEPVPTDADCRVELKIDNTLLKGRPPHVIALTLLLVLDNPKHAGLVKKLEPELLDFASDRIADLTYKELSSLSEKWRLRETLLLYLNEHLPPEACVREIYVTYNRLQ